MQHFCFLATQENPLIINNFVTMKNVIFLAAFAILTLKTYGQEKQIKVMYVGDAKTACTYNNAITSCLKVKSHPDSFWREFPYEIEGFIFEPGVETQIEVSVEAIANPQENGPKYAYKLIRVIESRVTVLEDKRILANNKWKLLNMEQNRKIIPAKNANAWFKFNIDSNKLEGFSGCNSLSGNTTYENGVMQFGMLGTTMVSCENDAIEKYVKEAMVGKAAFYVRNNILFIVCEDLVTLHLRPERKLDSIIKVISRPPSKYDGNTYFKLKDGHYSIRLDYLRQAQNRQMMFKVVPMTATEKKTMLVKLSNLAEDDAIKEVHILRKPHKLATLHYAIVIFKDGTKESIVIQDVH